MAGRDGIGLLIYSTLLILSMPAYCTVRTSNQITTSNTSRPLIPEPRLTTNLCSDDNADSSDSASRIVDSLQRMTGARFYLQPADIPPDQQAVLFLGHIGYALQLSPFIGLHSLVVHTNSLSVSQLEEVLTYAWTPSIEAYMQSPNATVDDAPNVRFLSFLNSSETLTITGSPVTRIIYTIFRSAHIRPPGPVPIWESKNNANCKHPQQRIGPPSLEMFIQILEEKGVRVYDQMIIPAQIAMIADSLPLEDSSLTAAKNSCRFLPSNQRDACALNKTVDVRVGGLTNYTLVSTLNGTYTQQQVTYVSCLTLVEDKVWIGWLPNSNASAPSADRPTLTNLYPIAAQRSFRVYTSQPVHLQLLPLIQQKFTKSFHYQYDDSKSVDVMLWNPDLDTGTMISFLVRLLINGKVVAVLDARLPYTDAIYPRLLRAFGSDAYKPEYPFSRQLYIRRHPIVLSPSLERECHGKNDDVEVCRWKDTFSVTTLSLSSELPSSEAVQQAMSSAFFQANPHSIAPASFAITLTNNQEQNLTLPGHNIVRYTFSFSYYNLTRGKFWNVWRFPSNETIAQTIASQLPGKIWVFDPSMTFTMYSSEPISSQLLPTLQETMQRALRRSSEAYENAEIVIWNPDPNGTVINFLVIDSEVLPSGIVDSQRESSDWIYRQVSGLQLDRNTMKVDTIFDTRFIYLDSDDTDNPMAAVFNDGAREPIIPNSDKAGNPITLSRHPPATLDHKQNDTVNDKQNVPPHDKCSQEDADESCALPSVLSLFVMKSSFPYTMDSDDVLRGVGDAFAEVNPVSVELNITLTRRTDGFLTIYGQPVVKFDFTVTYPRIETGKHGTAWRNPQDHIMNKHLGSSMSGKIVNAPFY